MPWVENIAGFRDFLSLVIVHAPDDFPREDFLADSEQLDLEKAFGELNRGMDLLAKRLASPSTILELRSLLKASHDAYTRGDDIKGAHLLQEFEAKAFETGASA